MRNPIQSKGLSYIAMLVLLGFMMPIQAATDLLTSQALHARLDRNAEVSVIVTLESLLNVATAKTKFDQTAHASRLRLTQQTLLDQLPDVDRNRVKAFKHVPQMAMTVNRGGLHQLLANPNIRVAFDAPHKLLLTQSVPHVFPTQQSSPYDGGNQWAVAVLDSGVDKTHPFLSNKVIAEACFSNQGGGGVPGENSVSTCPNGGSAETGGGTGVPCGVTGCDHGTRVAGVAAGQGASFDGVAKSAKIISIQVTTQINELVPGINDTCELAYGSTDPCVLAYSSDIISALDHVYSLRNTHKIAAVNLSLGYGLESGACLMPEKAAIDSLLGAGIATVVAAGNNGSTFQLAVPACISSAIAVGSTLDTADTVSVFSNSSTVLDLYAPGEIINSSVPGGSYSDYSGTSMAAPHVAGAWAVIKHAKPGATVSEVEALFKSHGPEVAKPGTAHTRRRLALTDALNTLCSGGACDSIDDDICIPVKTSKGGVALICL